MGLSLYPARRAISALAASPLNSLISKNSAGAYFGAGPNQMSNSFIGLRGKQEIADNLYAVFNLQTLFDVNSGLNSSGIGSITQNNGLTANVLAQNCWATRRSRQMFNGAAYFGLSSPTYGTVTMGRQSRAQLGPHRELRPSGRFKLLVADHLPGRERRRRRHRKSYLRQLLRIPGECRPGAARRE